LRGRGVDLDFEIDDNGGRFLGEWLIAKSHEISATSAHGTETSDSEPKASSTGEDGRSQGAADGGKAVMEGE
jgi:hypothetical protein